ncbi:MAG: hypothetical protein WBM69_09250 [Desulfobacterales bacterium]
MAKLKKRKLRWHASSSPQVIGYKLYWAERGDVDYNSNQALLGNVTEIVLPDDVDSFKPSDGQIEFGITSVDELGNESDMITLKAPYQFSVPKAPQNLEMEKLEQFHTTRYTEGDPADQMEAIELIEAIASEQNQKSFSSNKPKRDKAVVSRMNDFHLMEEELKVGSL